jgi:hypothetical protein
MLINAPFNDFYHWDHLTMFFLLAIPAQKPTLLTSSQVQKIPLLIQLRFPPSRILIDLGRGGFLKRLNGA